jgi:hypothetical protein
MASDQQVTARIIMQALLEFERRGSTDALKNLEAMEPDLTEFLLERLTDIHHDIQGLGGSPRSSRRVYRNVQTLVLVAVEALRRSHFELWRDNVGGTRLDQIDPSLAPPAEPDPDDDDLF